jgi:hypothetical protein
MDGVPEEDEPWYCVDCDVYGQFIRDEAVPSQQQFNAQQQATAVQAANLLTRSTRGSAFQLSSRLPRVRSRPAVTAAQPGRAVQPSRRPQPPAEDVIEVEDDTASETDSWNSDTPIAFLRPNSRAQASVASSARPSRRGEAGCTAQCNVHCDEPAHSRSCCAAAQQLLSQSQDGTAAEEAASGVAQQHRPRLRVRSAAAQPVRPTVSTARPSDVQPSDAGPLHLKADHGGVQQVYDGPAQAGRQPRGTAASGAPLTGTVELSCSHKRVREGAGGCQGFEVCHRLFELCS